MLRRVSQKPGGSGRCGKSRPATDEAKLMFFAPAARDTCDTPDFRPVCEIRPD